MNTFGQWLTGKQKWHLSCTNTACKSDLASVQARDLLRRQDIRIDRTERVANSLGNLLGVLQKLLAAKDSGVKVCP